MALLRLPLGRADPRPHRHDQSPEGCDAGHLATARLRNSGLEVEQVKNVCIYIIYIYIVISELHSCIYYDCMLFCIYFLIYLYLYIDILIYIYIYVCVCVFRFFSQACTCEYRSGCAGTSHHVRCDVLCMCVVSF